VRDQIEGNVDPPRPYDHGIDVLVDGPLIEGIDLRRLSDAARGADLVGHRLQPFQGATGEEHTSPLPSECTSYGTTDRPAPSVDHSGLTFEQHAGFSC